MAFYIVVLSSFLVSTKPGTLFLGVVVLLLSVHLFMCPPVQGHKNILDRTGPGERNMDRTGPRERSVLFLMLSKGQI